MPELVREVRPDAIIATGRSDYPNQVNNVLCFPFIFRGALDVGATTINEAMKIAAVEAIAGLARVEASEVVAAAYGGAAPVFGPDYIIPKPFDPRLILEIAPAVARAAMDIRRRAPADHGLRRLSARAGALRVPLRPAHAPGVRGGEEARQAHRLCRGRGRAGAARRADACSTSGSPSRSCSGRRDVIERGSARWACAWIWTTAVRVLDPDGGRRRVRPAGARLPAPGRAARHLRRTRRRGGCAPAPRSRRRCCCTRARRMPRSAAAPANWWRQMQYVLPIIPRRPGGDAGLCAVLPDPADAARCFSATRTWWSIRPPSRSPR